MRSKSCKSATTHSAFILSPLSLSTLSLSTFSLSAPLSPFSPSSLNLLFSLLLSRLCRFSLCWVGGVGGTPARVREGEEEVGEEDREGTGGRDRVGEGLEVILGESLVGGVLGGV
jgi:hypothetical protein